MPVIELLAQGLTCDYFQFTSFLIYQELIGNYIYMEEYFMRETVMKVKNTHSTREPLTVKVKRYSSDVLASPHGIWSFQLVFVLNY